MTSKKRKIGPLNVLFDAMRKKAKVSDEQREIQSNLQSEKGKQAKPKIKYSP